MGKLEDRLEKANGKFRTWTDQVNQLVADAEARACAIGCGREAWAKVRDICDEETGAEGAEYLGFVKIGDRWRLAFAMGEDGDPELSWVPLSDCSLSDRIRVVPQFEELFEQLITAREEMAEQAREAAQLLKGLLDTMPIRKSGVS